MKEAILNPVTGKLEYTNTGSMSFIDNGKGTPDWSVGPVQKAGPTAAVTAGLGWTVDAEGFIMLRVDSPPINSVIVVIVNGMRVAIEPLLPTAAGYYLSILPYLFHSGDRIDFETAINGGNSSATIKTLFFIPAIQNQVPILPGAGLVDYSTTEQSTGRKWVDGKVIYQRTVTGTTGANKVWKTILAANGLNVIDAEGFLVQAGSNIVPLGFTDGVGNLFSWMVTNNNFSVYVNEPANTFSNAPCTLTIRYTK